MTTEKDPNGLDPHKPGAKLDAGKPRVGLMFKGFARALLRVAEVTTFGANKYTPNGWESVDNGQERYLDAGARHLLQGFIEPRDPQTDIEHLAHEAWNALARLELALREAESAKEKITAPVKVSPDLRPLQDQLKDALARSVSPLKVEYPTYGVRPMMEPKSYDPSNPLAGPLGQQCGKDDML